MSSSVMVASSRKIMTSLLLPPAGTTLYVCGLCSCLSETNDLGVQVLAEPDARGSLNYDEVVVYTNDAIRPSYLVMYEPIV
jgi:hypothetical protein